MVKYLGLHETLDVHELLTFKNISLTKSATMSKLATDEELQAILASHAETSIRDIQQLQQFLTIRED
jgi:similar to spore coat protein